MWALIISASLIYSNGFIFRLTRTLISSLWSLDGGGSVYASFRPSLLHSAAWLRRAVFLSLIALDLLVPDRFSSYYYGISPWKLILFSLRAPHL